MINLSIIGMNIKIVKLNKNIIDRISPVLLEFLQKNNCLDKFVKNIEAMGYSEIMTFYSIAGTIVFRDTPEGPSYWRKLQIDFDDYIMQKLREKHG